MTSLQFGDCLKTFRRQLFGWENVPFELGSGKCNLTQQQQPTNLRLLQLCLDNSRITVDRLQFVQRRVSFLDKLPKLFCNAEKLRDLVNNFPQPLLALLDLPAQRRTPLGNGTDAVIYGREIEVVLYVILGFVRNRVDLGFKGRDVFLQSLERIQYLARQGICQPLSGFPAM